MISFSLETATFTEVNEDGFIGIQTDPQGDGSDITNHEEHQYGFIGRPCDPDEDGLGCYVLRGKDGSESHCWFAHDPRSNKWLPQVNKGGSTQYGGQVGRRVTHFEIDGTTNSITAYVPVAWDGDGEATAAHKLELGVDNLGASVVQIAHSVGSFLIMLDDSTKLCDVGGSYIEQIGGAINLNGTTKIVGGLDVGGTGGVEVPLHPGLVAALEAFATAIAATVIVPQDGGAALLTKLIAASEALSSAVAAAKSTMLKTL